MQPAVWVECLGFNFAYWVVQGVAPATLPWPVVILQGLSGFRSLLPRIQTFLAVTQVSISNIKSRIYSKVLIHSVRILPKWKTNTLNV